MIQIKIFFYSSFFFFLTSSLSFKTSTQEMKEVVYKGKSPYFNLEKARSHIFEEAIQQTSLNHIQNLIGQEKISENQALIRKKIIKNSKKYILFLKEIQKQRTSNGIELTVLLKISLQNLKTLLLNEGLFYKSEKPIKVLPLISFFNKKSLKKFNWWLQNTSFLENDFLIQESQMFHSLLKKSLRDNGFFGMSPVKQKFKNLVFPLFNSLKQTPENLLLSIGNYFQSSLIISGEIFYHKGSPEDSFFYQILIHLKAIQPKNNQVIGVINRTEQTHFHPFETQDKQIKDIYKKALEELSQQILNVWKGGRFGTFLIQLAIEGKMSYKKMMEIKKILKTKFPEIKELRESLHSSKKVAFDINSSVESQKLAFILNSQKNIFPELKMKIHRVSSNKIDVKLFGHY